jgi:hypothetical protein
VHHVEGLRGEAGLVALVRLAVGPDGELAKLQVLGVRDDL